MVVVDIGRRVDKGLTRLFSGLALFFLLGLSSNIFFISFIILCICEASDDYDKKEKKERIPLIEKN